MKNTVNQVVTLWPIVDSTTNAKKLETLDLAYFLNSDHNKVLAQTLPLKIATDKYLLL